LAFFYLFVLDFFTGAVRVFFCFVFNNAQIELRLLGEGSSPAATVYLFVCLHLPLQKKAGITVCVLPVTRVKQQGFRARAS